LVSSLTFAGKLIEAVQVSGAEDVRHALVLSGASLQSSEMAAQAARCLGTHAGD
jgi:hypothetical protein